MKHPVEDGTAQPTFGLLVAQRRGMATIRDKVGQLLL